MGGDAERVAREFFARNFDEQPSDAFERLAVDVVIKPPNGHIYIGHEGYARWHWEGAEGHHDGVAVPASIDVVREHWVLIESAGEHGPREAGEQTEPGYWLVHVRDGLVAAILHYETEQAAREALSEQR